MSYEYYDCTDCKWYECKENDFPCNECKHNKSPNSEKYKNAPDLYKYKYAGTIIKNEQPQEEINHPSRYANGKYECIDVMIDVFGKEAVKHFCLLNAFKYSWRQEHKGGTEDIKKAVWYLNKYIELEESEVKDES